MLLYANAITAVHPFPLISFFHTPVFIHWALNHSSFEQMSCHCFAHNLIKIKSTVQSNIPG